MISQLSPGGIKMKISARNMLKGRVRGLTKGPVNSEVSVQLSGGEVLVSVITSKSVENLDLKEGKDVYVVIKATNVMIATD
jgi:molybdopterin-binding protein